MVFEGRDVKTETLASRQELLEQRIVPKLTEPVRYVGTLDASLGDLVHSVKAQRLEGLVAKRRDSRYEPGLRSGAWMKMRVNQGQEFVIGAYTVGTRAFDALIFGYYEGDRLIDAARTRNGFTPAVREQLSKKFRPLEIAGCPFANLPEARSGRWGQGLRRQRWRTVAGSSQCWSDGSPSRTRRARAWSGDSSTKRTGLPIVAPMISAACRYEIASPPVSTYFLPRCPGWVSVTNATAAMDARAAAAQGDDQSAIGVLRPLAEAANRDAVLLVGPGVSCKFHDPSKIQPEPDCRTMRGELHGEISARH